LTRMDVCRCNQAIIETHPRVAWAVALSLRSATDLARLVIGYKGTNDQSVETAVRREMLEVFEKASAIVADADESREFAIQSADDFEALICAYVAMKHYRGETIHSGFEDGDSPELEHEGSAVLPNAPWLIHEGIDC
ncbi:MAG: DUF429 domain-containing protein, partial [Planctomycetaceae bacterium]|nr:DUF429 domain-containing protein [Planctomycetaceae bacterium]